MGFTTLCIRLMMFVIILLGELVQRSHSQNYDAALLRVTPDRLQFYEYESVSFQCEAHDSRTQLTGIKNHKNQLIKKCDIKTASSMYCTIIVYASDNGEYWCETEGGQRSNTLNISITAASVILESPVLPVTEGEAVTLRCRKKTTQSNFKADFYKDDLCVGSSLPGEITIHNVSKSNEGLYKCSIPGVGASPGSWLAVRAFSVILESPVLPVMEGANVTLRCRKKTPSSNLTADFYKDGLLLGSSSTGNMTVHKVSKSDEGLYKCRISGAGDSAENWLAVRARVTCLDHSSYLLLLLRTVFTILMVALLLVGLLHFEKLIVKNK